VFYGLRQIRPDERRDTFVAMATLFLLMAAHALLETARDALFLSHISPAQLPFVYIGVALAAFGVVTLQERGPSGRWGLTAWLVFAGLTTIAFWPLVGTGDWVLYALYIWSAVIVTVAMARMFILLGDRFTASQAKRLYATIGVSSVVGAIVGSGTASLLATLVPPEQLLVMAGGVLVVAAIGPVSLSPSVKTTSAKTADRQSGKALHSTPFTDAKKVLSDPYARRVTILMVVFTLMFTLVDFVFKSEAAAEVDHDLLPVFLARVYFALNVGSLFIQLFVVRFVVRVLGPTRSLALLPGLLIVGGAGLLFGGGIYAGVALKGVDGSLRHSLHRTASELLFVPMDKQLRAAAKTFVDIAGHRGGQAFSSLVILAVMAGGGSLSYLGAAIAVLALIAVFGAFELRHHYLNVFRSRLTEAAARRQTDFPELDLSSFGSLMEALNSPDEKRVLVVLELLGEQGRANVIPGLILYHPSPDVLALALELLATTDRTDFIPHADRLLDHEYAHVRAAALRTRMQVAPDEALLRRKLEVSCPVVRATALVGLTAGHYASIEETSPYLDDVVSEGSDVAKEALARAIGYGPSSDFDDYLIRLSESDNEKVLLSVATSMGKSPSPRFLPRLCGMLNRRRVRAAAIDAMLPLGAMALSSLEGVLADEDENVRLRRQIPGAIREFEAEQAAEILTRQLATVEHGEVRYRILRALNWLVNEDPDVHVDHEVPREMMEQTLSKSFRFLDWRLVLEAGAERDETRRTLAHGLLVKMLSDKEKNMRETLFRLIDLLHPRQDVGTIYRGLSNGRADVRSSSRELVESFLDPRMRDSVLGLIDDVPDVDRLLASGVFHRPAKLTYESLLLQLIDSDSDSIRSLSVYHIGELGLSKLRPQIEALDVAAESTLATVIRQAIAILSQGPETAQ
jgi:AAA family ATP:ADP antiporter